MPNSYDKNESNLRSLRSQRDGISEGHYRQYLVNLYNLYYKNARSRGTDWSEDFSKYKMLKATYKGIDEISSSENVLRWKKDLKDLGYLADRKVNGEWRVYILKELDF